MCCIASYMLVTSQTNFGRCHWCKSFIPSWCPLLVCVTVMMCRPFFDVLSLSYDALTIHDDDDDVIVNQMWTHLVVMCKALWDCVHDMRVGPEDVSLMGISHMCLRLKETCWNCMKIFEIKGPFRNEFVFRQPQPRWMPHLLLAPTFLRLKKCWRSIYCGVVTLAAHCFKSVTAMGSEHALIGIRGAGELPLNSTDVRPPELMV